MTNVTVITNNVPRLVIEAYELTEKEREEFDYLNWEAIEKGEDSASFVRYKGELYDLGDLETAWAVGPEWMDKWHALVTQTYFSGILFRFVGDDYVVMGRYYA
jgi:hypothetical protein